jgi:hypothetical protein
MRPSALDPNAARAAARFLDVLTKSTPLHFTLLSLRPGLLSGALRVTSAAATEFSASALQTPRGALSATPLPVHRVDVEEQQRRSASAFGNHGGGADGYQERRSLLSLPPGLLSDAALRARSPSAPRFPWPTWRQQPDGARGSAALAGGRGSLSARSNLTRLEACASWSCVVGRQRWRRAWRGRAEVVGRGRAAALQGSASCSPARSALLPFPAPDQVSCSLIQLKQELLLQLELCTRRQSDTNCARPRGHEVHQYKGIDTLARNQPSIETQGPAHCDAPTFRHSSKLPPFR